MWNVDTAITEDMLAVLKLANDSRRYPGDLGFEPEIKAIWQLWRGEPYTVEDNFDAPEGSTEGRGL